MTAPRGIAVIALAAAVAIGGSPAAQPAPPAPPVTTPAAAFAAGLTAYHDGDYAAAAAAFEEAFRGDPRPEVAFTLAQAHRNQYFIDHDITHLQRALGLYRDYLAEAPNGRRVAHARLHLETIEAILATLPDVAPAPAAAPPTQLLITGDVPGAVASIDGDAAARVPRLAEVTPGTHAVRVEAAGHDPVAVDALAVAERLVLVPASLHPRPARIQIHAPGGRIEIDGVAAVGGTGRVSAGEHVIRVTARGHRSLTRMIDVEPGAELAVDLQLAPTAQRRAARWTLIGAGALAGSAAIAAGLAWAAQADAVRPVNSDDPHALAAYLAARDRRNTCRGVAIGLAITAGAAAVTGASLWWLDNPGAAERPNVSPLIGPESIGAAMDLRF